MKISLSPAFLRICFLVVSVHLLSGPVIGQSLMMNTFAGSGMGFSGDGGAAASATFNRPEGLAIDNAGTIYIADEFNNRIRKVYGGIITTVAGSGPVGVGAYAGDGGLAISARLYSPFGIAVDTFGNLYIADNQNYRIRKVNSAGIITTIAGTGINGYLGDGGAATNANISYTQGLMIDTAGNLYVGDVGNYVVRKISSAGIITTIAGNGISGFSGDGGPATNAKLKTPRGMKMDGAGNIYFADSDNGRIRKISVSGIITTVAGGGSGGDGSPATAANIGAPFDVALSPAGEVFFSGNLSGIWRMDLLGIIHFIGGILGSVPFIGDGCAPDSGKIIQPSFIQFDHAGNLYFSDEARYDIRKVSYNHPPIFTAGHSIPLLMCLDTFADISSILTINDTDQAQILTWSLLTPPTHGVALCDYTIVSAGGLVTPTSLFYTPTIGYYGTDAFTVIIHDCLNAADTATINVIIGNCTLGSPHLAANEPPGLSVFPNPNDGSFTCYLAASINEVAVFTISNMLGQKIKETVGVTNKHIDVTAGLGSGIYLLSASSRDGAYNVRVVVR
jgi:hypothetical protein